MVERPLQSVSLPGLVNAYVSFDAFAPKETASDARPFSAVVLAADKPAEADVERMCETRQDAPVHGLACLQAMNLADEDSCRCCEFVRAVAICDPQPEGTYG
jgi:hypothetical protein